MGARPARARGGALRGRPDRLRAGTRVHRPGVRCVVAAPSKIVLPAGDRVKTDAQDAQVMARSLRMDELSAVRVPTEPRKRRGIWSGPARKPAAR